MNTTKKVFIIGDPHFQISNLKEVDDFIKKSVNAAQRYQLECIVILGDILHNHERLHTLVLNKAVTWIKLLAKIAPTIILVGNHDYINNTQFLSQNHWMLCLETEKNVTVVDRPRLLTFNKKKMLFVPYVQPGRFLEAIDLFSILLKDVNVVFAHQEFYGVKMGSITSCVGDKYSEDFPLVITGHIHHRHWLQPNIFYPGSAIPVAFGETDDATISLLSVGESFTKESITNLNLGIRQKKIFYLKTNELKKFLSITLKKYKNCIVKVCVDGTSQEFKKLKKKFNLQSFT